MNKYIYQYLDMLKYQKKYSEYTIINYGKDIEEYISYLNSINVKLEDIKYCEIENYLLLMHDLNLSKSTISRKLSSIRGLYKFMCEEELIKTNPFEQISSPKKDKKLPNYLYTNEMEDLLNIEEKDIPLNERNELIIELLYSTGIRVSELVNIKIKDINFDSKTIKILGKGQKERIVVFGEYAIEKLNKYINSGRIKLLSNKKNDFLLLNRNGTKITTRSIRNIINVLTSKAHLKSHISPHTLRHTFATHLLNEGADLTTVKELLGHKNLSTTSIYTHLSKEHLRNVYLNSHPRARKEK